MMFVEETLVWNEWDLDLCGWAGERVLVFRYPLDLLYCFWSFLDGTLFTALELLRKIGMEWV